MFSHLQTPEVNPFGPAEGEVATSATVDKSGLTAAQAGSRQQWSAIADGAALMAQLASKAGDRAKLAQALDLEATASGRGSLEAALLGGIFGTAPAPDLDNRVIKACHDAGSTASPEALAAAREFVRGVRQTEKAAEAARAAQRNAERRSVSSIIRDRKAAWAAEAKAEAAARLAAMKAAGLVDGQVVEVTQIEMPEFTQVGKVSGVIVPVHGNRKTRTSAFPVWIGNVNMATASVALNVDATSEKFWAEVRRRDAAEAAAKAEAAAAAAAAAAAKAEAEAAAAAKAAHAARVQAALDLGGIIVDGVVLCEDGTEFFETLGD